MVPPKVEFRVIKKSVPDGRHGLTKATYNG